MRVAVVGCGAMGAATGWRLATRGASVVCFDRHSPPHTFGSSHGESRITRTAYFEGEWYVPLLVETFPLWRELERVSGKQLLTMTGALMIGPPSSEVITGALAAATMHGLDARLLDTAELSHRYPAHVTRSGEVAVLDMQAGFVRPEAAVAEMIDRLVALGGEIRRGVLVNEVTGGPHGVEVVTGAGSETFDAAVIAAGPWMRDLCALPLKVERQVLAWFQIESVEWLTPDRFPVFLHETDLGDMYGFPTLDGASVKIARHHDGEPTNPKAVRRDVSDADVAPLREFARSYLRGVTGNVSKAAVCMYTNTPDRDFVIDLHPDDSRIVVISACSGHGFKFAPVIGDVAADLVRDGRTPRDISRFSVARFAKAAG